MELPTEQEELFDKEKPADQWEMQATKRALDELFVLVRQYKSSKSYSQLIQFISCFHFCSSSDKYLSNYLKKEQDIPNISIECVMKVAGLIEQMGREHLKLRKKATT